MRYTLLFLLLLALPARAAEIIGTSEDVTGWSIDYRLHTTGGEIGYTNIHIQRDILMGYRTEICDYDLPCENGQKDVYGTVLDPGTREVPVYPQTLDDAESLATPLIASKEQNWLSTRRQ